MTPPSSLAAGRHDGPAAGRPATARALAAALSLASAGAGLFIAAHHPLSPWAACVLFGAWAALSWRFPTAWLALLPALLPVASLAPWTGWVALDEFDLLVLATAAGVHARRARMAPAGAAPLPAGVRRAAWALAAWTLLGLLRGAWDAGGLPGWFDAYLQPLNAWRLAKPALWALLLLPALHEALQAEPQGALRRLRLGVLGGVALFVGAVLWERASHAGLMEFSSSYRTTALFWEMHVGGAAIDAYVALVMPFCAWALWRLRRPAPWGIAALLAAGTIYAALTTFSRGVYGAVALPLLLPLAWLSLWRAEPGRRRGLLQAGVLMAGAVLGLVWAVEALDVTGVALLLGLWMLMALAVWRFTRIRWRAAAGLTLAVVLLAEVVMVLGGGSFMRERMNASGMDLKARIAHWERGLALLRTPADTLLGLGLGRLPAHYVRPPQHPAFSGGVALTDEGVRLEARSPGRRSDGAYGLTQRVASHPGPHRIELRVRAINDRPAWLLVKLCESHLLYDNRCQWGQLRVRPSEEAVWMELPLGGPLLQERPLPRAHVLMLSARSGTVQVEAVRLYAGGAQLLRNGDFTAGLARWWPVAQGYYLPWHIDNLYLELLIERGVPGLALFLGLAAAALWRLGRRVRGRGLDAEAAVFLAASLCGALLVGLISGVMDMPRVAWLLWSLLWTTLLLPRAAVPDGPTPRA
ncbi:hypothetical protein [Azohydromonas caseinilytica]|uniref:O-antigen ligase n=1 Tax=Azohydromonas caseinilytica TaxID=2728836 RepID=A0A848F9U9_9BURK|nr:hypothetical protein [Azohydromonas caseinilytica]NML15626.1 hypothetical protein [Azohydromonas caseinilytica]